MHWAILTKDESVSWDQQQLTYFPGVERSAAPTADELEELWRTYYANIFNPARIKLKAMKAEMPVRHWATISETAILDQMLQAAPQRVEQMLVHSEGYQRSARDYFPDASLPISLERLAVAAKECRACDLHCQATQTVFGQGSEKARIVFVGGAQFAFGDGSVHFISENVDHTSSTWVPKKSQGGLPYIHTPTGLPYGTYQRLFSVADGQVLQLQL
jgi:DNA polymerase